MEEAEKKKKKKNKKKKAKTATTTTTTTTTTTAANATTRKTENPKKREESTLGLETPSPGGSPSARPQQGASTAGRRSSPTSATRGGASARWPS